MPTERIRYIDPDAAGLGTGLTLADAYVSMVAGIAGEIGDPNLVANDEVLIFECLSSGGSADTAGTPSISSAWSTDTDNRLIFKAHAGHEASTEWDSNKYRLQTSDSSANQSRDVEYQNLQIDAVHTSSQLIFSMRSGGDEYRLVRGCYLRYSGSGGSSNYAGIHGDSGAKSIWVNNIFDGWPNRAFTHAQSAGQLAILYNNTFVNCADVGIKSPTSGSNLVLSINNIFVSCGDPQSGTAFSASSDYNSTDSVAFNDNATGANNRVSQTFTFASATDYAITGADAGARTFGLDLTADANYPFADDIDGNVRAAVWDVGAYQVTVSPAGPVTRGITLDGEATHDTVQVMLATSNVTDGESVLAPSILNQAPEDNMQYYAPKSVNGMNITWAADGTFTTDADQTETIRVYFFSPAASQWGATDLTITQTTVTPGDTTPDAFSFTDVTGAPLSTVVESDTISVLGVDAATDIAVTVVGGEYAVDTGAGFGGFTSTGTNVQLGYDIKVRGTSSGSFSTPVDVTLTIGGVSDTFTITTVADIAVIVGGDSTGLSLGLGLSL